MPPVEDVQTYLTGAWRMMTGKPDGLRQLDLSSDGFWNSFFAIVIAAPVLLVGWIAIAGDMTGVGSGFSSRFSAILRLAVTDMGTWVLPYVGLAAIGSRVGVGDRFVHYVVAMNWGSVLLIWMMLPAFLIRLFVPDAAELSAAVGFGIFVLSLVLSWRLTNAAIDKGAGVATGVFAGMLIASILTQFAFQDLLGIEFAN